MREVVRTISNTYCKNSNGYNYENSLINSLRLIIYKPHERLPLAITVIIYTTGKKQKKVEPFPNLLSTTIEPPWFSITFLQMARPIPVPS